MAPSPICDLCSSLDSPCPAYLICIHPPFLSHLHYPRKLSVCQSYAPFLYLLILTFHLACTFPIFRGLKEIPPSVLLLFSCSVMSDTLQPHGLQHARLPCSSSSPGVCSNSCPLSWWCHPTISSFVALFSCPQSFPASPSFLFQIIYIHCLI